MIYQTNLIATTIGVSGVALAAGFPTSEWATNHVLVRFGEEDMTGNTNIGRLPIVTIREVVSTYNIEAQPDNFGTRNSEFKIRIYVPTTLNRNKTAFDRLQKIKQKVMEALTKELKLETRNFNIDTPVITQMSIYQDINLTTETSYDNNYSEGTT